MLFGLALTTVASTASAQDQDTLDSGDTAWMITATLLVLLMTLPGLALFYGGLVLALTGDLDLELLEQPVPPEVVDGLRELPQDQRERIALDESLHTARDALALARPPAPAGVWVLKLMKSGGVGPCTQLARIAAAAGTGLMWGCMDESRVSIAAALHAAYASPATRLLDLDGHLDLARDPAAGGFVLEDGRLYPTPEPGLGVTLERGS